MNDAFEYSETLKEDYLRGLIGKVVTKKRAELISFIRNGGEQPKMVDAKVWKHLKKLAHSKQHEQKSEQGR